MIIRYLDPWGTALKTLQALKPTAFNVLQAHDRFGGICPSPYCVVQSRALAVDNSGAC